MATWGYITLGKQTKGHQETLEGLGYTVLEVRGHEHYVDHLKVRVSGFVTKELTLKGALLQKLAAKRGALTYDVKHLILGEPKQGVQLCGAIRSACKKKDLQDLSCLVMRREPKPRRRAKKSGDEIVDIDF